MRPATPLRCVFALVILGAPAVAPAATILRLEAVADGSAEPPGDRLDVAVLLVPGEDDVGLETRAFVKLEGREEVVPVDAKPGPERDERGRVLIRTTLRRRADSQSAEASVVVPYACLDLPPGRHELGYEVRGHRQGRLEFARATPLAVVVVSGRTRTTMRLGRERLVPRTSRETRTAYVVEGGRAVAREVEITSEEARPVREIRTEKVAIPGEFSRPTMPVSRSASGGAAPDVATRNSVVPLEDKPWAALAEFEPRPMRTVYYATNRAVVSDREPSPARFGTEPAEAVSYGSCLVNIPVEQHTRGQLERPTSWWESRDPRKHFLIEALAPLPRDLFLKAFSADDVLLYVHGYNTTFEGAVLRGAQLVHDLRFPGRGLAFSWPSAGALSGYAHDERVHEAGASSLAEVLRLLVEPVAGSGRPRKVHVIAHSMGNRVFLKAARQLELERPSRAGAAAKAFGHVALAAPDVDAATFAALVPSVIRQAESTTLYYCQSDRALIASRAVHLDKPVGLGPFFAEGLDTINADRANTSLLGHGYYASAHPLLTDLMLTVVHNQKPDQRHPPLGSRTVVLGYAHWLLVGPR